MHGLNRGVSEHGSLKGRVTGPQSMSQKQRELRLAGRAGAETEGLGGQWGAET